MKKLLCLLLLTLPIDAQAVITGPISTDTGDFTLHWEPAAGRTLVEVSGYGQTISSWQTSPARIVKSIPGDYHFEERWCGWLPISGYGCRPIDRHTVTFSRGSGQQQPQLVEQGYRAYYADVDGNGLQDVYVERLTTSSLDGSLQSYVLLNRGNGTLSTVAAGEAGFDYFAARARSFPDQRFGLDYTDLNADGDIDHVIPGWVLGVNHQAWEPEAVIIVFAPGVQGDRSRPQAATIVTPKATAILEDVAYWMDDPGYFEHNFDRRSVRQDYWDQRDPYFSYRCSWTWQDGRDAETNAVNSWLAFTCEYVPQYQEIEVLKFDAMGLAGALENALYAGDGDSLASLLSVSQSFQRHFGVPMFGFDRSGNWVKPKYLPCGYGDPDRKYCRRAGPSVAYWSSVLSKYLNQRRIEKRDVTKSPQAPPGHDYSVNTKVCDIGTPGCTVENVACWIRHFHAPMKVGGYGKPAEDGKTYDLGSPVPLAGTEPIRTRVGPTRLPNGQPGLPDHSVANITLPGHSLHPGNWFWSGRAASAPDANCPRAPGNDGNGPAPAGCNQIYRLPVPIGGSIFSRTRGTGENDADALNQRFGPWVFEDLDESMIAAMRATPSMKCPSTP